MVELKVEPMTSLYALSRDDLDHRSLNRLRKAITLARHLHSLEFTSPYVYDLTDKDWRLIALTAHVTYPSITVRLMVKEVLELIETSTPNSGDKRVESER